MKTKHVIFGAAVLLTATAAVVFVSCKSDSAKTATTIAQTVTDKTKATTLSGTGATKGLVVTAPAGAVPVNGSLALDVAAQPTDFTASTTGNNTAASAIYSVAVSDSTGTAVAPASTLKVVLPISTGKLSLVDADDEEANESADDGMELTAVSTVLANLYVLLKATDGTLYYWSSSMLSAVSTTAMTIEVDTTKTGTFQAAYLAAPPSSFKSAFGASITPGKTYSAICNAKTAKAYCDGYVKADTTTQATYCTPVGGTYTASTVCPNGAYGICHILNSGAADIDRYYYTSTAESTAQAKADCSALVAGNFTTTWEDTTGTATSTAAASGTFVLTSQTCNGKAVSLSGLTEKITYSGSNITIVGTVGSAAFCTLTQSGTVSSTTAGMTTATLKAATCTGPCTNIPCTPAFSITSADTFSADGKTLTSTTANSASCNSGTGTTVQTFTKQ